MREAYGTQLRAMRRDDSGGEQKRQKAYDRSMLALFRTLYAVEKYYKTGETITFHEYRVYNGHVVEYDIIPIELYKMMIETVLSFGGDLHDDATLYRYIIELASNELLACVPDKEW